jgi:hypothetical protein
MHVQRLEHPHRTTLLPFLRASGLYDICVSWLSLGHPRLAGNTTYGVGHWRLSRLSRLI